MILRRKILSLTIYLPAQSQVFDQHLGSQLLINVLHKVHVTHLCHPIIITCKSHLVQVMLEATLLFRDGFGEIGEGFAALELGVFDNT